LEDGVDTTLKTFTFEELDVLGGKGRRAEYLTARAEGKLEEAGFKMSPPPTLRREPEPYDLSALNDRPYSNDRSQKKEHKQEHKHEHKHERKLKPEQKEHKLKHGQPSERESSYTHPQPLDGSKHKKPHHKRRKKRG
jgi:hypothetical protein